MEPAYFLLVFVVSSNLALIHSAEEVSYPPSCPPFSCGKLDKIGFPFFSNATPTKCGLFEVGGCDEEFQKINLGEGIWYTVHSISPSNALRIFDQSYAQHLKSNSCEAFKNLALPHSSSYFSITIEFNVTLFKCNRGITLPSNFSYTSCSDFNIYYYNRTTPDHATQPSLPPQCSIIQLPYKITSEMNKDIFSFLTADFSLEVHVSKDCFRCHRKGGQCDSDSNGKFRCLNAKTGKY